MSSLIVKCGCTHEFQDATYGKGSRLANVMAKKEGEARCSVCSRVHQVAGVRLTSTKKKKK